MRVQPSRVNSLLCPLSRYERTLNVIHSLPAMRSQQRTNCEILSDLWHSTSNWRPSNNTPSPWRAPAATLPVRVRCRLSGIPSSGQDRQHKNRSTTPNHRPSTPLDPTHRDIRWTRSPHRCPTGYPRTGGLWTRARTKCDTGARSLLRGHRSYNRRIRLPVFLGIFISGWPQ